MNKITLKIIGNLNNEILDKIPTEFKSYEVALFCGTSANEFDIPINTEFKNIYDRMGNILYSNGFILKYVTQEFFKPFEWIPSGWKSICVFDFISGVIPNCIIELPKINGWYDIEYSLLFTN